MVNILQEIYLGTVQGVKNETFVFVEIDGVSRRLLQTIYMTEEEVRKALADMPEDELEEKIAVARESRVRTKPPITQPLNDE